MTQRHFDYHLTASEGKGLKLLQHLFFFFLFAYFYILLNLHIIIINSLAFTERSQSVNHEVSYMWMMRE